MMLRESDQLVQRYYDALNERELEELEQILAPSFILENSGLVMDLAAFRSMRQSYVLGFPDLYHEIRQVVREGRQRAVLTETTGTHLGTFLGHPATARNFRVHGMDLVQINDLKVARIVSVFDTLGMLAQLGLYAPMIGQARSGMEKGAND